MKISTVNCSSLISKAFLTLIVVIATVFGVQAQNDVTPKVTSFYPSIDDNNPSLIHSNTSMYIYFNTTVVECNAQVIQNDKVVGNLTFVGNAPAAALPVKKDMLIALLDNSDLQPGKFVVKPVSVTYINADGDEVEYEDTKGEWLTATYTYGGESGKVTDETEFANRTVKSWYPVDSEEGTKTITFNKAIKKGFNVVLEYGNGESSNNFARIPVPYTLSDDSKSITIDLRGRLHSVNSMVPNAHFVDENGNPVAPPTVIALAVYDLYTVDGLPVIGVWKDPVTGSQLSLTASLYYSYDFQDGTLPTPKITGAKFENSTLILTLTDNINLVSADVVFIGDGGALGTVTGVNMSTSTVNVQVPTGIDVSKVASISLENAVYNTDDGAEHVIRPFNLNGTVPANEVTSISAIKALNNKDKFKLICDGVKVTFSNPEAGYIFIEDESGAIQVDPESGFAPKEGTILTGTLEGSYFGEGLVAINPAESEYIENEATIEPMELTLGDITFPVNNYRLVKISLEDVNCEYSDEDVVYFMTIENFDTPILGVIDLIDDDSFEAPRNVKEFTGIVYCQPFMGDYMIVARHKEDIVEGSTMSISTIVGNETFDAPVYTVGGVKVRNAGESLDGLSNGVYIIGGKKVIVK